MKNLFTKFKKALKRNSKPSAPQVQHAGVVIPRSQHVISRKNISKSALKVLYRLRDAGYTAYLVGGSVRDLLLGITPKDFDIATNARPEQIRQLFRKSFIVGRRFQLVHIIFGYETIEVATFRGAGEESGRVQTHNGLLLRDNVFGALEEDVWRRDFSINALYYTIDDFSVIDYVKGMADLDQRIIRVLGDPSERYREDPVRMLRALRLAGKLDFQIEEQSAQAIREHKHLLSQISPARLFDKVLKFFQSGKSYAIYLLLREYDVFPLLFPEVAELLHEEAFETFVTEAFKNTDERIHEDKKINPAFLFAILLWGPLLKQQNRYLEENHHPFQAFELSVGDILQNQLKHISIPRKFTIIMREIWFLQQLLESERPHRIFRAVHHQRFRAAYDFFLLRSRVESHLGPLVEWWEKFHHAEHNERDELIKERFPNVKKKRKRKKAYSVHRTGE